jgi:3-oxoadipate enol-lactonase
VSHPTHAVTSGTDGAPPVVLSHSLGASLAMWDPQVPVLEREFRVVRYDTRGHGQTAPTPGPYTLDLLGQDLVTMLDELGLERVAFCGLSLGGLLGMWLASRHPERVGRLVLCNTAPRIGTSETWAARMDAVRAGGMANLAEAVMERWFTAAYREREPGTVSRVREAFEETPPEGYLGCCAAIRDADERERLASIRSPTLVIAGAHDVATPPAHGRAMAGAIPGARYVELGAAHLSNVEAAEAFNDALSGFLRS